MTQGLTSDSNADDGAAGSPDSTARGAASSATSSPPPFPPVIPNLSGPRDETGSYLLGGIRMRWVQLGMFIVMAVLSLVLVLDTSRRVSHQLEELRVSTADDVKYTISQLEVEGLELQLALRAARLAMAPSSGFDADRKAMALRHLRVRFDIFYSRTQTMRYGITAPLIDRSGGRPSFDLVSAFLAETVPLIDGPDADLIAGLPRLEAQLQPVRSGVRQLVNRAVVTRASEDEMARQEVSRLLQRLLVLALLLLASLLGLLVVLYRLYRLNRLRAIENKANSARLATILATSPDAILVTTREGVITDFNPAAEQIFGLSADDVCGKSLARIVYQGLPDAGAEAGARPQTGYLPSVRKAQANLLMTGRRAGGRRFPIELSTGLADLRGQLHVVIFLRDISQRIAASKALEDSRDAALSGERAKARFMAVMSHEMRTPLNGILGVLELLGDRDLDPETREYLGVMQGAGEALLGHVNDVLDIARIEAEGISLRALDFDLDQLLAEVVGGLKPLARARGNRLFTGYSPPKLGRWRGDPARLRQVLTNLLSNAVKFTEKGEVSLEVVLTPGGSSGPGPQPGGMLEVQISDTGRGIPAEALPHVFEDFMRVEAPDAPQVEGTGLGLGIVRRLVSAMGGELGAESEAGEGSLFWVRLPLEQPQEAPESSAPTSAQGQIAPPQKVLMVEDNATNRFILREMLRRDGHRVVEAVNGREGVDKAMAERFDLILMDLSMPVMDGFAASQAIRAGQGASCDTRIVALTAHVLSEEVDRCKAAGMDLVMSKPLSRAALRGLLADAPQDQARAPSEPEVPLLDHTMLVELSGAFEAAHFADLIAATVRDGDALLAGAPLLDPASAAGLDPQAAHDLAGRLHHFAGLAATLGARRLHAALNQCESHLRDGAYAAAAEAIGNLPALWNASRAALQDWRAPLAGG